MKDILRYDKMVESAMRGVVREALAITQAKGRPGAHHFYITFRTGLPGVELPQFLRDEYPQEMTIVLEHQFWDLEVTEQAFSVTLQFRKQPQRLVIPFEAITSFADPSVKFGLQFQAAADGEQPAATAPPSKGAAPAEAAKSGQVVTLDQFRKK